MECKQKEEFKKPRYKLEKGLVQVYTGEGKGKTTAAAGLALRAAGAGLKVGFFQFFKKPFSGEIAIMKHVKNIRVHSLAPMHPGFRYFSREDMEKYRKNFQRLWTAGVADEIKRNRYDVIVLDEILIGIRDKFIDEEKVLKLIDGRPANSEIVLTGRHITDRILERADVITEMKKVKHPFPSVKARRGIEY
ncbi:MAG: cob(I)yrinic acid a,c-diamide adenosyltransferase [Candidatus Omnitrophica bacterium]|nr:cob(I)yrinic acid a,c-diamide adenosyltransferase [Candidatus Omnitrophota bacterium]